MTNNQWFRPKAKNGVEWQSGKVGRWEMSGRGRAGRERHKKVAGRGSRPQNYLSLEITACVYSLLLLEVMRV